MSQLLETRFGTHVYVALFSMVDIAKSNSCNPNHRICEHVRSQDLHHKVIANNHTIRRGEAMLRTLASATTSPCCLHSTPVLTDMYPPQVSG